MSRIDAVTIVLWLAIVIAMAAGAGSMLMTVCEGLVGFVRRLRRMAA